jgi:nucleotide-binding universal stress UspA family protein
LTKIKRGALAPFDTASSPTRQEIPMYRRFLVPVDGSHTSNKALVTALQMARDCGGDLRLIHVENELLAAGIGEIDPNLVQELLDASHAGAEKVLDDAMAIATAAGVKAEQRLVTSFGERLGDIVAREALDWKADLIVVGSHGRRGIGRVLLGSGCEQIVRLAPVPVLVIRSGEAAGAEEPTQVCKEPCHCGLDPQSIVDQTQSPLRGGCRIESGMTALKKAPASSVLMPASVARGRNGPLIRIKQGRLRCGNNGPYLQEST